MKTYTYIYRINRTLRSTDIDRKVNLICYTMEIDVRRSLSSLNVIVLYVQMLADSKVNFIF